MIRVFLSFATVAIGLAGVGGASAADCDFSKPVGSCKGTITLNSAKGSKPNYSAEFTVRSSAPSCSKVEYYIDNTPHQTVFKSESSDRDSTFGTSPITKRSFQVEKCTAYLDRDQVNGGTKLDRSSAAGPSFFQGRWSGRVSMLVFSSSLELTISVNGNRASGRSVGDKDSIQFTDGSISGGRLTYSFPEPASGKTVNVTLTKISDNTIRYSGGFSGVLTRQ
ncbi:hypothetical protein [Rhizobium sp. BK176]|uniref:hypothetical protein n=1 Tax=Rhizobium sp. BK176 TaxID=2587071 RepID=UPI00216A9DDC|nr:hypothetical protein [Rhizobium sp. BK176]MCS4089327.1 hypothetical protein [Rhizobium sp. BK176]